MQQPRAEKIEAYIPPGGVSSQLLRDRGAPRLDHPRRPGTVAILASAAGA
jgi:hypothetical protein